MERKITIVPAKEEYLETAGNIAIKAWIPIRHEYRRILGEGLYERFFSEWQEKKKRAVMQGLSSGRGYVALVDGCVAGFVSYKVNSETKLAEIMDNAVDPDYRGMGIGSMMYQFVLEKMREEGILHAVVTTGGDDAHAPARRSYEKVGFEKGLPYIRYYMDLS